MRKLIMVFLCLFAGFTLAIAQSSKVEGLVLSDDDGQPVIGASVVVKGTTVGTVTDYDGKFHLSVPADAKFLEVSYIGLVKKEVPVKNNQVIRLQSSVNALDEVMVVAYGTSKKSSFTGSASVVSGKELEKLQTSNITKSLEGTVAGIQTTSNSGQPGSAAKIFVRGIGSIYSNQEPLYVVDGVIFEGSMNSIAPSDIESMTVLKDAAANSLYGSRGANGVVLITLKKGKQGKARIVVDARWGVNNRANEPYEVFEEPAQYYEMAWESLYNESKFNGKNDSTAIAYAQANLLKNVVYNNYKLPEKQTLIDPATGKVNSQAHLLYHDNWLKEAFTNGFRQEYTASLSGGIEKTTYYASFGYLDDAGYVPNSKFNRYSTRISVDQKLTDWINLGANLSYTNTKMNSVTENSSAFSNIFMFAQNIAPIYPVYLYNQADGALVYNKKGQVMYDYGLVYPEYGILRGRPYGSSANPLGTMRDDTRDRIIDYFSGKSKADLVLPYGFRVTSDLGFNLYNYNDLRFMTPLAGDAVSVSGRGYRDTRRFTSIYWNQLLLWEKSLDDAHNMKFMFGHETTQNDWFYMSANKSNYFNPYNPEFDNATSIDGLGSYTQKYAQEGYFIQGNYDYTHRYYISASFRRDASSKFASKSRWGNFWSVGASWRINEEEFMKDVRWVNDLKLKSSYGTQGNDGVPNMMPYASQYTIVPVNNEPGVGLTFRGNPNLTWEKSQNFNAGFEGSFLDARVKANVDFFIKNTKDQLFPIPTIPSEGRPMEQWRNEVDMRNIGVEFDMAFVPVKTQDLTWTLSLNGTHYRNKLTKLPSTKDANGYQEGMYWREKGGSFYDFFMVEFSRINPDNGAPLFFKGDLKDDNGNRIETDNPANSDAKKIGKRSLPDFFGGLGTSLSWKGFDFSAQCAFSFGGYTYDSNYSALMQMTPGSGQNWHMDMMNRWTPENKNTHVARVQNSSQSMSKANSTYFLTSSSYFSLRNVSLGYTLPTDWVSKLKMGSVRFYFVADNVFLSTKRVGMDPRTDIAGTVGNTYAPIRTISGGVTLNF